MRFQEEDLDDCENQIYQEIKKAKEKDKLKITIGKKPEKRYFSRMAKTRFVSLVKEYFKNREWKGQEIESACNQIWKETQEEKEEQDQTLRINDSFRSGIFSTEERLQNLFFLHGAFHIVQDNTNITKIQQKQNKAFCQKLEETIHDDKKEIICIFTAKSSDKMDEIKENEYLKKCFDQLSQIEGSLVIYGSSLADNDEHIFTQINKSKIRNIYISSCEEEKDEHCKRAKQIFRGKSVTLFDYKTISYEKV